jgi:hypothetical protein
MFEAKLVFKIEFLPFVSGWRDQASASSSAEVRDV